MWKIACILCCPLLSHAATAPGSGKNIPASDHSPALTGGGAGSLECVEYADGSASLNSGGQAVLTLRSSCPSDYSLVHGIQNRILQKADCSEGRLTQAFVACPDLAASGGPLPGACIQTLEGARCSRCSDYNRTGDAAPYSACGTACARLQSDNSNCGQCGNVCGAGSVCLAGDCAQAAPSCKAWRDGGATQDGPYPIDVGGSVAQLYCDMTTDGGGWTLIRRSNGTTSPDLRTEAAVNVAGLSDVANSVNAQLSSEFANSLGSVLMARNLEAGYDTTIWFDKTRVSEPSLRRFYWTYQPSLPGRLNEQQASSIYPPSEDRWGQDVCCGTHVNYDQHHPLCFGDWNPGGKGHFCYNRDQLDWWNYGVDAATSGNPHAVTALYIR